MAGFEWKLQFDAWCARTRDHTAKSFRAMELVGFSLAELAERVLANDPSDPLLQALIENPVDQPWRIAHTNAVAVLRPQMHLSDGYLAYIEVVLIMPWHPHEVKIE